MGRFELSSWELSCVWSVLLLLCTRGFQFYQCTSVFSERANKPQQFSECLLPLWLPSTHWAPSLHFALHVREKLSLTALLALLHFTFTQCLLGRCGKQGWGHSLMLWLNLPRQSLNRCLGGVAFTRFPTSNGEQRMHSCPSFKGRISPPLVLLPQL